MREQVRKEDVFTAVDVVQDMWKHSNGYEMLSIIRKFPMKSTQCICLANMVDRVEIPATTCFIESFVFCSSLGGMVAICWLGWMGFYYYVIPVLILLLIVYICAGENDPRASIIDESHTMGVMLSAEADSLAYFYTMVCTRGIVTDICDRAVMLVQPLPRICGSDFDLTRNIVLSALCNMQLSEICLFISSPLVEVITHMNNTFAIKRVVTKLMSGQCTPSKLCVLQRITLILAVAERETYPVSSISFKKLKWVARVIEPLREISCLDGPVQIPETWLSSKWNAELVGFLIPLHS
jgi:hypothetical protein